MNQAIKLSAVFWISIFVLVLHGCMHPVQAAESKVVFECNGERLTFNQSNQDPIIMSIAREKGTWMQVPSNRIAQIFYNLDTGKVAKVGKNYAGKYYVEFFKDVDYANAFKPERTLPCLIK